MILFIVDEQFEDGIKEFLEESKGEIEVLSLIDGGNSIVEFIEQDGGDKFEVDVDSVS